ncbi:MAG: helix-turn-helix transcriptional regulator [Candidatus Marinimicrobia bacterium]|nr:helix-turn-helix transcriptional regulator [Candidatus Neomarinimicrobiota bacterium]
MKKKTNVELHKERLLQKAEFKQAYNELGPVYKLIREIVAFRIAQGMTQKELAEKIGTKQSSISRFEKAMKMPSISFLSQITNALGLEWEFNIHTKSV